MNRSYENPKFLTFCCEFPIIMLLKMSMMILGLSFLFKLAQATLGNCQWYRLIITELYVDAVVLTQTTPLSGVGVCPGQELIFSCNSSISNDVIWTLQTIEDGNFSGSAVGFNNSIIWNFRITIVERVITFPFSIVSTTTLKNALFSHNNTKIKCTSLDTNSISISSESRSVLTLGELNCSLVITLNACICRYSCQ